METDGYRGTLQDLSMCGAPLGEKKLPPIPPMKKQLVEIAGGRLITTKTLGL